MDLGFYHGVIARSSDCRYLVFFDDGNVQLIPRTRIRRVEGNDSYFHAHPNAKDYFEFYMNNNLLAILPDLQTVLTVDLNGIPAKVIEIDRMLALIHFPDNNRFEWIYMGSPRISKIHQNNKSRINQNNKAYLMLVSAGVTKASSQNPQTELTTTSIQRILRQRSATNHIKSKSHSCCSECVLYENENVINIDIVSALQRPLLTGWSRYGQMNRFYKAPCGVFLHSLNDIQNYLDKTNSKLRIDCFELNSKFNTPHIGLFALKFDDISNGLEKIPIGVRGPDNWKSQLKFNYIGMGYPNLKLANYLGRDGCNCENNCRDKLKCSCWQLTVRRLIESQRSIKKSDYKKYINIGYSHMRLKDVVATGIVECNETCKCCAEKCSNRVSQKGLQHKLELFWTKQKGWGVKAKTDIPEAMFISVFAGDVFDSSVHYQRDTKYQFLLPSTSLHDDDSDIEMSDGSEHSEGVKLGNEFELRNNAQNSNLNYFPQNGVKIDDGGFVKNSQFVVDGLYNGNICRFFNHSCDPNLFTQMIHISNDKRFPFIAFFTKKMIKAGEELTFDYGYNLIEGHEMPCYCEAINCRKRLS